MDADAGAAAVASTSGRDDDGDIDGGHAPLARRRRPRTADAAAAAPSFADLLLPAWLTEGLADAGFLEPSPVQAAAIPLGRAGADLLVRARSGTGKTAAFGVVAVGLACPADPAVQVLCLAPTREVALQTADVLAALGGRAPPSPPGLAVAALIGGLPLAADAARLRRPAHVVTGTPGRVAALAARGDLGLGRVRLLVLDEVDALLAPGGPLRRDVEAVAARCPPPPPPPPPPRPAGGEPAPRAGAAAPPRTHRQTLAFSATLDAAAVAAAAPLMAPDPAVVDPAGPGAGPALLGVTHFYVLEGGGGGGGRLPAGAAAAAAAPPASTPPPPPPSSFDARAAAAAATLARTPFCQAALFTASRARAARLAGEVRARGGHAVALLTGGLPQPDRMDALAALAAFTARVAVLTDVGARGVDLERVTLVINVDLPADPATLAHRAGRAGRFGGAGACVSVVAGPGELASLQAALAAIGAPPAAALPDRGLEPEAAHGGYVPPSAEEAAAWAAHEARAAAAAAAEVVAAAAATAGAPPTAPRPAAVRAYAPSELLGLRPAASPRPACLPPAVARREAGEAGAAPPPATPAQPTPPPARPTPKPPPPAPPPPPPPPPPPVYDDAVYDDEAALAAAIIAAHHAAEGGGEEGEGEWGVGAAHPTPTPTPTPPLPASSAASFALPNDALVPVPAALLRRYYELEWDAYTRRVEAWRAVREASC